MNSNRQYVGRVSQEAFGARSKSAHQAVYIETPEGRFVLRKQGGNPFYEPEIADLVGKTIRCTGEVNNYVLTISKWEPIAEKHS